MQANSEVQSPPIVSEMAMLPRFITDEEFNRLRAGLSGEDEGDTPQANIDSHFLELLTSAGRERFAKIFTEEIFHPGQIIYQEGEPGDNMYIIWSGKVVAYKGELNSPTILGFRGAGEVIGEMALLENRPRSASVVAISETRMLCIQRGDFHHLLAENPVLSLSIMESLSARLRKADEARNAEVLSEKALINKVSQLQTEKQTLLELQRLRQETSDLIIHDLRNPLSSVSVALKMIEMVMPAAVLEVNRELLDIAHSACDRMQRLVDSLLEVARMEAGESYLTVSEIDLRAVISDVLSRISPFHKKAMQVETIIPNGLPRVPADLDKIDRVLTNLVDNALKFTQTGGKVIVRVETHGRHIRVHIEDNGPGIPEEDRQRIFERFSQIKPQLAGEKRKRRGFGLGLAYCRLAIEAHGGNIWVEEGEGEVGSRFTFSLPLQRELPLLPN